jgi:hypothetical protein
MELGVCQCTDPPPPPHKINLPSPSYIPNNINSDFFTIDSVKEDIENLKKYLHQQMTEKFGNVHKTFENVGIKMNATIHDIETLQTHLDSLESLYFIKIYTLIISLLIMTFITNIIVLYAIISMYRKKSIFEPYPVLSIPKQTGVEMSHIHNDFSDTTV